MTVIFIADVCTNYQSSLDRCLAFIDRAAEIGCAAVNFQLFENRALFSAEAPARDRDRLRPEPRELRIEFLPEIATRCRERGVLLGGAPRHLGALGELLPFLDFFNIGPHELGRRDLLAACGRTGKPVVLATGTAPLEEVSEAAAVLRTSGCNDLALLHCASSDPAPSRKCNLALIETLREQFGYPVGWLDHSVQPAVLYRAVHAWSADVVEFRLDVDGAGAECSAGHCWLPEQIAPVIRACSDGFRADGSAIKPTNCEDTLHSAAGAV